MSALFEKGTDAVYRCVRWERWDWADHGFANRYSSAYLRPVITLRQIHSAYVVKADGMADRACEGDALVSDERANRIGVRTADCVPLLFVDPEHSAVAAVHAGWRG